MHGKSGECVKTELDLFSVPPTQVSLEKGLWIDQQPVSSVADGGPITFLCPGTEDYVDLSKTILVVRAKVTKANGDDLDADDHVGIVNNFLHSLFKQVDVFLKEKQVTQATGAYAYRAYLETLLNYGPAAKESQLTAAMFYKDTAGKMDVADPTLAAANANMGLKKRYAFNQESGVFEMAGPLFCDVFKSERLLLSFVDLKVILNRNFNAFCIMSDINGAAHKVKLTEAYLKVRKVKVSPSVSIAHELALKKGPAIYPVRRVECKTQKYNYLRNLANRKRKQLRSNYLDRKMDQLKSNPNPKKWWDCIKQLAGYPKKKAISSMVLDDEILTGDVLANKINDFFTSITNEIIPLQPEHIENQFEFNECYIHPQFIIDEESVFNKLSDICVSKSLGSDGISNWVLKHYAYILALPVASLFNASIQQQHVPTAWKKAEVIPIPKTSIPADITTVYVLFH